MDKAETTPEWQSAMLAIAEGDGDFLPLGDRHYAFFAEERPVLLVTFEDAAALLGKLGFLPTLGFEKRRESWSLDGCLVELDELPHFGTFVEIEGDSESLVLAVRTKLALDAHPLVAKGYIRMIDELGAEHFCGKVDPGLPQENALL